MLAVGGLRLEPWPDLCGALWLVADSSTSVSVRGGSLLQRRALERALLVGEDENMGDRAIDVQGPWRGSSVCGARGGI